MIDRARGDSRLPPSTQDTGLRVTPDTLEKKVSDGQLELALRKYANKTNEGNNGVICRIDIGAAPELTELQEALEGDIENKQAIKILKIYLPGEGKHEYEMQKRAYDIVASAGDTVLAKVPKPILFRDLPINEETKLKLQSMGISSVSDHVEIIIMDFIEGEDLATILFREAVKRHPQSIHLQRHVDEMTFNELLEEVNRTLYSKSKSADQATKERVFEENAEALYDFLEKSGFVLPSTILDQIKKTIELFHKNGLCFRDGHHRNFMIRNETTPSRETIPQAYIVDFGSSITFEGDFSKDLYTDTLRNKRYPDDSDVVVSLKRLTQSKDAKEAAGAAELKNDLLKLKERLKKTKEWQDLWGKVLAAKKNGRINPAEILDNLWVKQSLPTTPTNFIGAAILELLDQQFITQDEASAYLSNKITDQHLHNATATRVFLQRFIGII